MKFAKTIVRYRAAILILTIVLMIPAILGYANTRVNYDMLNYLPDDFETVQGQNELMKDFGKGAFSLLILENMPVHEVSELKTKLENVEHVDSVIWYDTIADLSVPLEILPKSIYEILQIMTFMLL